MRKAAVTVAVGAVAALTITGAVARWTGAPSAIPDEPPRIVLRAAGGAEQAGEHGSFCWRGPLGQTCANAIGTGLPTSPLVVRAGAPLELDFRALGGLPEGADYEVYRRAEAVTTTGSLAYIDRERVPYPAQTGNVPPGEAAVISLNLPPDRYVMEVYAVVPGRGDTTQGFDLRVAASDPAACPTATLPASSHVFDPRRRDPKAAPTPDVGAIPLAPAPGGLGRVALPADGAGVAELFVRLPSSIAGKPRRAAPVEDPAGGFRVAYGDPPPGIGDEAGDTGIFAGEVQAPPQFTAGHLVAKDLLAAREPPPEGSVATDEVAAGGRDGALVWARGQRRHGGPEAPPVHYATWGRVDSRWSFAVHGDSAEEVDQLLAAFVAAAEAQAAGAPVPPTLAPAPTATPAIARDVPDPAECRVAPRTANEARRILREIDAARPTVDPDAPPPAEEMVEIRGEPPNVTVTVGGTVVPQDRPPATPPPFVLPAGWPADAATTAGVTATYRERTACYNALAFARALALETDAEFRRSLEGMLNDLDQASIISMFVEPVPAGVTLPPEELMPVPEIREVRVLADGRVGVVAFVVEPDDGGEFRRLVYVEFARVGGRWLFDSPERTIEDLTEPVP